MRFALLLLCLTSAVAACGPTGGTRDAGTPLDAGESPIDAGEAPTDAGDEPIDAGEDPVDAGEEPPPECAEALVPLRGANPALTGAVHQLLPWNGRGFLYEFRGTPQLLKLDGTIESPPGTAPSTLPPEWEGGFWVGVDASDPTLIRRWDARGERVDPPLTLEADRPLSGMAERLSTGWAFAWASSDGTALRLREVGLDWSPGDLRELTISGTLTGPKLVKMGDVPLVVAGDDRGLFTWVPRTGAVRVLGVTGRYLGGAALGPDGLQLLLSRRDAETSRLESLLVDPVSTEPTPALTVLRSEAHHGTVGFGAFDVAPLASAFLATWYERGGNTAASSFSVLEDGSETRTGSLTPSVYEWPRGLQTAPGGTVVLLSDGESSSAKTVCP